MGNNTPLYEERGVSSSKENVQAAIKNLDPGIFPGAFCKILPDVLVGDDNFCTIQHVDGAGTKSALAYLVWKETGDLSVWKGIVQDSLAMNINDAACVGSLGPFVVSLSIARNKARIPGEVISTLIEACDKLCSELTNWGIPCHFAGGETADLGDLARTIIVDNTITSRMRRDRVINAANIKSPAILVGFSSTGQASWEPAWNSGVGSNGLTNARHSVLGRAFRVYTETYAPETSIDLVYSGKLGLDRLPSVFVRQLLSPTRTYAPLISLLIKSVGHEHVMGLIHCSGGGQTKIKNFGSPGITYRKNNLFPTPEVFELIQKEGQIPWKEMFATFNMGHMLEAVVDSREAAEICLGAARDCMIDARIIGEVILNKGNPDSRRVIIEHERSFFTY